MRLLFSDTSNKPAGWTSLVILQRHKLRACGVIVMLLKVDLVSFPLDFLYLFSISFTFLICWFLLIGMFRTHSFIYSFIFLRTFANFRGFGSF